MSANPYENEPGFEDANDTSDKKNQKDYVQKVSLFWGEGEGEGLQKTHPWLLLTHNFFLVDPT